MFSWLIRLGVRRGKALEAASFGNHWPNTANPIFEMVGYVNGKYLYLNSFSWNLEVPQVTQSTPGL